MDQNQLDESERIIAKTLGAIGDSYWFWYPNKGFIKISDRVYSLLGYKASEFDATINSIAKLLHPNDLKKFKTITNNIKQGSIDSFDDECKIRLSDGSYKLVIVRAVTIASDENSKPFLVVGKIVDIGQHIKTQEELLVSERRLKRAQEIALIGSWQEGPSKHLSYWTPQTYSIFGINNSSNEPSLKNIYQGLRKNDIQLLNNFLSLKETTDSGNKISFEFQYKCPNGEEKFLLLVAEAAISTSNEILFWQGIVQDISSRYEYERILKEDKDNLLALVTNMPALVFATDISGNFVFWNRTCEQLTGYKANEIIGNREALNLLYPEAELRKKIRSYLKDMGISLSTWEHQITTKKGIKLDVVWSAFTQYVKVEGWHAVAIGYDITHQKKSEKIQTLYRQKLEALAETATSFVGMPVTENVFHFLGTQLEKHSSEQIFMNLSLDGDEQFFTIEGFYGISPKIWERIILFLGWNPVGRRLHATPEMLSAFQRDRVVLANKSLYEFSGGIVSAVASRRIERLLSLTGIHTMGIKKDTKLLGGVVLFSQLTQPEADFSLIEGLIHQAAMAQDRHIVEEHLLRAKEKAEEADKLKTAFLANMSHEIRTPMNAILGFSQLLSIPNLTDEKKEQYLNIINTKGNSLVKLINDIIDASKVEAGQLTLAFTSFRVNDLLKTIKQFYDKEKVFQQRESLEIRLTIPKRSNRLEIFSDQGRLEQVLTNLMDNALKFTEKGFIEFGYTIDDKSIDFYVADSGVGIDSSKQQLIFDRFRQVEGDALRFKGGTGLGLSISKGIVDLLGGKIWVESSLGKGAKFFFSLPNSVVKEGLTDEEVIAADEIESKFPDWKNLVLLIAEDEEVNYLLLKELLEPTGVNMLWARDGAQAVELVSNIKKIDAILMDIKMPIMNGYAATMEIRQINASIPIVAQTAYAFTEDRQKAEAAGCDDYLVKPIQQNELFRKLDILLKKKPIG
jgi:PAS domain S-box-containing protein